MSERVSAALKRKHFDFNHAVGAARMNYEPIQITLSTKIRESVYSSDTIQLFSVKRLETLGHFES